DRRVRMLGREGTDPSSDLGEQVTGLQLLVVLVQMHARRRILRRACVDRPAAARIAGPACTESLAREARSLGRAHYNRVMPRMRTERLELVPVSLPVVEAVMAGD